MQEFWINSHYTDTPTKLKYQGAHIQIYIPERCQYCNRKLKIVFKGDSERPGTFTNVCSHYYTYNLVWENRLQLDNVEIKKCDCGGEKANTTHSTWCSVRG